MVGPGYCSTCRSTVCNCPEGVVLANPVEVVHEPLNLVHIGPSCGCDGCACNSCCHKGPRCLTPCGREKPVSCEEFVLAFCPQECPADVDVVEFFVRQISRGSAIQTLTGRQDPVSKCLLADVAANVLKPGWYRAQARITLLSAGVIVGPKATFEVVDGLMCAGESFSCS